MTFTLLFLAAIPGAPVSSVEIDVGAAARVTPVRGVESTAKQTFIHLADDDVTLREALRRADALSWDAEEFEWSASVELTRSHGLAVGDRVEAWNPGAAQATACRVTGFEVYREPSWESDRTVAPSTSEFIGEPCGRRGLRAMLTCDGPTTRLALATTPGRTNPFLDENQVSSSMRTTAISVVQSAEVMQSAQFELAEHALELGSEISVSHRVRRFELDGRPVLLVTTDAHTGEGHSECGGPDLAYSFETLLSFDKRGRVKSAIVPTRSRYETDGIVGLVDVEGDGVVEVLRSESGYVWSLETADEVPILQQESRACGCSC